MADAKKCDWCGSFYEDKSSLGLEVTVSTLDPTTATGWKRTDLCSDCETDLRDFISDHKHAPMTFVGDDDD